MDMTHLKQLLPEEIPSSAMGQALQIVKEQRDTFKAEAQYLRERLEYVEAFLAKGENPVLIKSYVHRSLLYHPYRRKKSRRIVRAWERLQARMQTWKASRASG